MNTTGDETWVHHHDPETKQESNAMETEGVPYSQEILCAIISQKDHDNSFWNSEGVLLLEFMPHKTSITGDTYASTMVALCENIKEKCHGKLSGGVLLLHDNAPAHKSHTTKAAIRKCGFVKL